MGPGGHEYDPCLTRFQRQLEQLWCLVAPCKSVGRDRTSTGVEHWVKHAQLANQSVETQTG